MIADHRRRSRRRGAELEAAILDATLTELDEVGYAAVSMDGVAARARVSKASLYRRWQGKTDLIVNAVYRTLPDADDARDTGSLRSDLIAVFGDAAAQLAGPAGAGMRGILSDALSDPATADDLRARRKGRGTAVLRAVIARAAARGEIATHHGFPPRVLEVGHAMLRHEFLFTGSVTDHFIESMVDDVVLPLLSRPRLQGDAPSLP